MEQTIYADRKPASTIAANLHHATYRFQCNMGMVNGIASIVLYEVYQNIRESKLYKQQVKRLQGEVQCFDDGEKR